MDKYEFIRTVTIRGTKVKKIIKMIKTYELIFGRPQFPLTDLADEHEIKKKELEIKYYSLNDCTKTIRKFIDDTFEVDSFSKGKEFKKKAFAGAKVVSVMQFIDHNVERAERNLMDLETDNPLVTEEYNFVFEIYWKSQIESLRLMKNLILSQYISLDEEEMDWVHKILQELEDEE